MNHIQAILKNSLEKNTCGVYYNGDFTSYHSIKKMIDEFYEKILLTGSKRIGLLGNNSLNWIVTDLCCVINGITCVPVPIFFNKEQVDNLIKDSNIDHLCHDLKLIPTGLTVDDSINNIAKITYTSGTTGSPKGVCLSFDNIFNIVNSLNSTVDLNIQSHINILPYSTLLENIAGIYLPIVKGANIYSYSLNEIGFNGSSSLDIEKLHNILETNKPESMILVPEILRLLYLSYNRKLYTYFETFKFISVGGGKINEKMLLSMSKDNIPVFEGYGLSECSSVVALNTYKNNKIGSAGKVLPHLNVEIIDDEIVVSGNVMLGYLNHTTDIHKIYTGDLGYIDSEGFLFVSGRKKNTIVTGFGRKVSPEWIEDKFKELPYLKHCLAYGDENSAISLSFELIDEKYNQIFIAEREKINAMLPDYAKVHSYIESNLSAQFINGKLSRNKK
jgi:long-subunit acyl-CoA synthetase (AMP-forming)